MSGSGIMPREYRELVVLAVGFVPGPDGKPRGDVREMAGAVARCEQSVAGWPGDAQYFRWLCLGIARGNMRSLYAAELNAALAVRWPVPPPIPHSRPAPFLSEDC